MMNIRKKYNNIRKRRASTLIEYGMLLLIIFLAIFGTQVYIKRALSGYWRQMADTFGYGRQYDAGTITTEPGNGCTPEEGHCSSQYPANANLLPCCDPLYCQNVYIANGQSDTRCRLDPCTKCYSNQDCYDCGYSGLICMQDGTCVECLTYTDCPPGMHCFNHSCGY